MIHRELRKKIILTIQTSRICTTQIRPEEWNYQTSLGFWDIHRSPNVDQTTRPCNSQQKKRTGLIEDFAAQADHRVKLKESEKRDDYLYFAREHQKTMEYEGDGDTNCGWCTWDNPQRIGKATEWVWNKSTCKDHLIYSIIKIS